jgi:XRE family transcriptional regulator, regulator of sulfur utilization
VRIPPNSAEFESATALFARGIRRCRKAAGLTIEKAAEAAGLTPHFLGHLERGNKRPSMQTILDLAIAYKVSPATFFKGTEPQTAEECRQLITATLEECSAGQLRFFYRLLLETLLQVQESNSE